MRRLAFIGSAEIGRAIQQRAATHVVKTVTLELGGKNPIVVFADADVDAAIDGALRGMAFTWQGQSCGSTSRLLVHRSLHEEFVARLGERMDALRCGPPEEETTDTGAIVHRRQYEKVLGYLQLGRDEGARVVAGGGPPDDPALARGHVRAPDAVRRRAAGLAARPGGDLRAGAGGDAASSTYDEALAIANGVSLGLTASVYTPRPRHGPPLRARHRGRLRLGQRRAEALSRGRLRRLQGLRGRPRGGHRGAGLLRAGQERQRELRLTRRSAAAPAAVRARRPRPAAAGAGVSI